MYFENILGEYVSTEIYINKEQLQAHWSECNHMQSFKESFEGNC